MGAGSGGRGAATLAAVAFLVLVPGRTASAASGGGPRPGPGDWPTYGHDAQHTFHGRTTLDATTATALRPAWFFPTGDAVTATPTVVAGTVYAGSWDGWFYAIDLHSGALRWKFPLDAQPAISPQPGQQPRDATSDGGMVTSSAWFEPAQGRRPPLVLFGGGYTLYALDAVRGRLVWKHGYTGRPDLPPDPTHDDARIFSSPVVTDGRVIVGLSVDGRRGRRGYVVAASLATGNPVWVRETDVDAAGRPLNDGCGNVWSSGTLLPASRLVVFDVADCRFSNPPPLSESVVALRVADGRIAWTYRPARSDRQCDLDFGATANAGVGGGGTATFLGVGGKDGTYYSLDPRTGRQRWRTNVVFGGFSGGFIGTAGYDGHSVYGATALGDFGRFEGAGMIRCDPSNPRDVPMQEPTTHSFDAATGRVRWQASGAASFGPTTIAGGLTFNGSALRDVVQVRAAASGQLLSELALPAPCWSGIATVGDALVLGTGASHVGAPDGVFAFTPGGTAPTGS
ncbi:MAG TPA: PQQ-binding-like beta-propeller repeat protein [Acidimicrobiia bacterium]|nr:PQQ-binding-like beta-propeller repeat protein [Acidimicrobiia bacterium]